MGEKGEGKEWVQIQHASSSERGYVLTQTASELLPHLPLELQLMALVQPVQTVLEVQRQHDLPDSAKHARLA